MARFLFALAMTLFVAFHATQAPAADAAAGADPAVAQIETFYAALIDTMKQGDQLGIQGRFDALGPVTEAVFDIPGMARLSVGPAWLKLSEDEKAAIIEAFERLTLSNYAKNFASYAGEKFTVDPDVAMRNDDKIVESALIDGDGKATPFNYRMRMTDGAWKVIDVYLNGYVSQLALRRSDFASTVAQNGATGLVAKINELVDRQMKGA